MSESKQNKIESIELFWTSESLLSAFSLDMDTISFMQQIKNKRGNNSMGSKQMTKRIRLLGWKLSFDGRTYGDEHIFFGGSCVTVHFVFSNPYYI